MASCEAKVIRGRSPVPMSCMVGAKHSVEIGGDIHYMCGTHNKKYEAWAEKGKDLESMTSFWWQWKHRG